MTLILLNLFAVLMTLLASFTWTSKWKRRGVNALIRFHRIKWIPAWIRYELLYRALMIQPIGGASGQNGAIVMLKVDVENSAGEDFQFVGGQANLTINETTAEIDVSDKLSGRLGERVPGRATASVAVDVNFLRSDATITFLKGKYRNRENVNVLIFDRDDLSQDAVSGTNIESATGIITNLTETHPDQDKSTLSLEINLNNDWNTL